MKIKRLISIALIAISTISLSACFPFTKTTTVTATAQANKVAKYREYAEKMTVTDELYSDFENCLTDEEKACIVPIIYTDDIRGKLEGYDTYICRVSENGTKNMHWALVTVSDSKQWISSLDYLDIPASMDDQYVEFNKSKQRWTMPANYNIPATLQNDFDSIMAFTPDASLYEYVPLIYLGSASDRTGTYHAVLSAQEFKGINEEPFLTIIYFLEDANGDYTWMNNAVILM